VSKFLGHKNLTTTTRYLNSTRRRLRLALLRVEQARAEAERLANSCKDTAEDSSHSDDAKASSTPSKSPVPTDPVSYQPVYFIEGIAQSWLRRSLCLANIPTAVKHRRGGAHRARTTMDRLSTTLITMVSRRPRGQSSDTVVRRRDPVQEHQSTLRAWTWVGRTVRAAAGPGRYWFGCWCGREGDRER
jgi:hypothetical protein